MEAVKTRKVRSDKKKEIKPSITQEFKECLYRLSYITNTPVKDIGEKICISGIQSRNVLEFLSQSFRRSVHIGSTLYIGDLERPSQQKKSSTKKEKITIKFHSKTYDAICILAYALDVTPSRATALLLHATIYQSDYADNFVQAHMTEQLDTRRLKELKKVLQYINESSDQGESVSWTAFLSLLYEEFITDEITLSESVYKFLEKWRGK